MIFAEKRPDSIGFHRRIYPEQYYYMHAWSGWCTMKILVLSDSHSSLRFMRECIATVKPDCVIHLGDYYDDGDAIAAENPQIPFYRVPGNCDLYRCSPVVPDILVTTVGGVGFYLTHGHKHSVKSGIERLLAAARTSGAQAVLFGHTHSALCRWEPDGLLVMNPGSSGFGGGSAGVLEIEQEKITACRIIGRADLDSWV